MMDDDLSTRLLRPHQPEARAGITRPFGYHTGRIDERAAARQGFVVLPCNMCTFIYDPLDGAFMSEDKFRSALIAMAPDAEPDKHRSVIRTSLYELTSIVVKNEGEAVRVCRDLVRQDGIQSFLLCPGFTNKGVARISEAAGDGVSVNVARGDGPSNAIAHMIMAEVGFFRN